MVNYTLLNPGPANVSERVRQALTIPDMCHREEEFGDLLTLVRKKLLKLAKADYSYTSIILTGSGTAAIEAMVTSVNKGLFVLNNGIYGQRIVDIAQINAQDVEQYKLPLGDPYDFSVIQDKINQSGFSPRTIGMVHHDTSTGILNPLQKVSELCNGNRINLIIDAVSSLGGENLNMVEDRISMLACTANKCIQGFPGISFVIAKKDLIEQARPLNYYLDLKKQYHLQEEQHETPFTPAIQILNALNVALDELFEEGAHHRIKRYKTMSNTVRDCVEELKLKFYIPRELMGNTVTSIKLPEGIEYKTIHDQLKKRGYIIYAGQAKDFFRIANMGCITPEIIEKFCGEFKEVITNARQV